MESVSGTDRAAHTKSLVIGGSVYFFWGIMPIYWKLLGSVPAYEIMANRVFWSFIFVVILLLILGKGQSFITEMKPLFKHPQKLLSVALGAFLISLNWFAFIWAINEGRILECSLGYYINPLVNVLIGVTVLRERLSIWQFVAVLLATVAVLKLTLDFGSLPWVALFLAVSMGLYGLCKKVTGLTAINGLAMETAFTTPLAGAFLFYLYAQGQGTPPSFTLVGIMLVMAGAATAVPLLLFAYSINRLSLTVMGFLQYISPSMSLILGVFVYGEQFTSTHAFTFSLIWLAIILFTLAKTPPFMALESRVSRFFVRKR